MSECAKATAMHLGSRARSSCLQLSQQMHVSSRILKVCSHLLIRAGTRVVFDGESCPQALHLPAPLHAEEEAPHRGISAAAQGSSCARARPCSRRDAQPHGPELTPALSPTQTFPLVLLKPGPRGMGAAWWGWRGAQIGGCCPEVRLRAQAVLYAAPKHLHSSLTLLWPLFGPRAVSSHVYED